VLTSSHEVMGDDKLPDWRQAYGGGLAVQPSYIGSKRDKIMPTPFFDVRYEDLAFLSVGEGVGVNLLRGDGFRAGVAVGYDLGRNTHDDPRIRNLPNVAVAAEPKIFAQYFLSPVVLTLDLRKGIGGNNGIVGDVGAYVPIPLNKANSLILFAGPSVTLADGNYMKSYFSVSPESSRISGLRAFDAGGGLANAGAGTTLLYLLGDHWLVESNVAYQRLLGDAGRSPIPQTRTQFVGDFNIGYRF
jgi:outer membrane scaffolding protein for murein synthesis (MipA/OmpV family)